MKLTLENIGKVKHAEIDLSKDLIVLCGPNNTGKTYVAYSVYGLFGANYQINGFSTPTESELSASNGEISFANFFGSRRNEVEIALSKGLSKSLIGLFAANSGTFDNALISVEICDDEIRNSVSGFDESLVDDPYRTILFARKGITGAHWDIEMFFDGEDEEGRPFIGRNSSPAGPVLEQMIKEELLRKTYIDPAERIAINVFSKELAERRTRLVDELLDLPDDHRRTELMKSRTSRYPVPIRESIYAANRLDVIQKQIGPLSLIANDIEELILFGKLSVGEFGEVLFSPHGTDSKIGIHMTGSVVKALANIVFYLRHQARPGDFYIIDEPELTLHPDNQRKMARILARMVNAGIKVMMSTHSDYIIRELNNLMMLKVDGQEATVEKLMVEYGYKTEELLDFKKVGAYLFKEDVSALEVNETGFEVSTIDDEINSLNNSSAEIYFKLHD